MANRFLDVINGNDSLDGTTYANRKKSFASLVAAMTAGDDGRIAETAAASQVDASAVYTDARVATPGITSITSSTNATPISIAKTAHGYVTGDIVLISGHTTNDEANGVWTVTRTDANNYTLDTSVGSGVGGATGTARLVNKFCVKLSGAVTKAVSRCKQAWSTTGAAVAATLSAQTTNYKESTKCRSFQITQAGTTTGLIAFMATPILTDFSAYQQITFWIRTSVSLANGTYAIKLCTDIAGAVAAQTFTIPSITVTGVWVPITIDNAGALSAAVQSVALYRTACSAQNQPTILLDNIVAVKSVASADSLSFTSLIGKSSSGGTTSTFLPVRVINGQAVMLDLDQASSASGLPQGMSWSSETAALYKREPYRLNTTGAGAAALLAGCTFSCGWTTASSMTAQTSQTWLDFTTGSAKGIDAGGKNTVTITGELGVVRADTGICIGNSTGFSATGTLHANSCVSDGFGSAGVAGAVTTLALTNLWSCACAGAGMSWNVNNTFSGITMTGMIVLSGNNLGFYTFTGTSANFTGNMAGTVVIENNNGNGMNLQGFGSIWASITASWNNGDGLYIQSAATTASLGGGHQITTLVASSNATNNLHVYGGGSNWIGTATCSSSTGNHNVLLDHTCNNRIGTLTALTAVSGKAALFYYSSHYNTIGTATLGTNGSSATIIFARGTENRIYGGSTTGGTSSFSMSAGVNPETSPTGGGSNYLFNMTFNEATKLGASERFTNGKVYTGKVGGTTTTCVIYTDGGTISSTTSVRDGASGIAWDYAISSTDRGQYYPLSERVARVAVASGAAVTVTCRMRRDSTGTLKGRLLVRGKQIGGVDADVSTDTIGAVNTWETVTLANFTPSEAGVIEVEIQGFDGTGTTSNLYVDNFSVTQV